MDYSILSDTFLVFFEKNKHLNDVFVYDLSDETQSKEAVKMPISNSILNLFDIKDSRLLLKD